MNDRVPPDEPLPTRTEVGEETVDLPEGMPRRILRMLKRVWVCNTQLNISKHDEDEKTAPRSTRAPSRQSTTKRAAKKANRKQRRLARTGKIKDRQDAGSRRAAAVR